jgi:dipeptidyl aminopeptidase/acylaminoacyl peptidase
MDFVRHRWDQLTANERRDWQQTGRLRVRSEWLDVELGYGLAEEASQFAPEALAGQWSRPLLIFHGMCDTAVPYTHSLTFVQQVNHPDVELRLYRTGDHRLLPFKDEIAEAACAFIARRL